jgi:hypothetical protein
MVDTNLSYTQTTKAKLNARSTQCNRMLQYRPYRSCKHILFGSNP